MWEYVDQFRWWVWTKEPWCVRLERHIIHPRRWVASLLIRANMDDCRFRSHKRMCVEFEVDADTDPQELALKLTIDHLKKEVEKLN